MSLPVCPPGYECEFHKVPPPHHVYDPWWTGPAGTWVTLGAIVALVIVLCVLIYWVADSAADRRRARENARNQDRTMTRDREERQLRLAIEEQRTMQLDAAKGNPEMLKMVREMQRERL